MEKNKKLTIWVDFTNSPHVNFLMPIVKQLKGKYTFIFTARDFSETVPLLKKQGVKFKIFGKHEGKSKIQKLIGVIKRNLSLLINLPKFDVSISCGGINASQVSWLRRKKSICFDDNDISSNWLYTLFGNYFFYPKILNIKGKKVYLYDGYKENIYIADFKPNLNFIKTIPFQNFVTIRPENLKASYVPKNARTIVPELFKEFSEHKINILFLPRYEEEKEYVKGYSNIYVPSEPLNGLDVCFYSDAVLTGAGTFSREAACMGTPAISFYPGKELLAVDNDMIKKGLVMHSRDHKKIVDYVLNSKKKKVDLSRSKKVQKEVFSIVNNILEKIENKKFNGGC